MAGEIFFHLSVEKACFVFHNPHCPILETALHHLQLRIMSGSAGIRLQSVLSGAPLLFSVTLPSKLKGPPFDFFGIRETFSTILSPKIYLFQNDSKVSPSIFCNRLDVEKAVPLWVFRVRGRKYLNSEALLLFLSL